VAADKIGIIGGSGWLGCALAKALISKGFVDAGQLIVSNRSGVHPLPESGVQRVANNQQLVDACDIVIIAVRPEQFQALTIQVRGKLLISLMAGVPAAAISAATGASKIVRAMANAAVDIGQSFTPWHCDQQLAESESSFIQRLLECVGTARRVPTEDCIDYLSALSGTGPALPALLMTALYKQAVAAGIPDDVALNAARGVVVGASQLLANHDPQQMIDTLVGYRGVTAAALQNLIAADFEALVGQAVLAGATVARRGL
jgi:pyrroline-5-carboxylate reductase